MKSRIHHTVTRAHGRVTEISLCRRITTLADHPGRASLVSAGVAGVGVYMR